MNSSSLLSVTSARISSRLASPVTMNPVATFLVSSAARRTLMSCLVCQPRIATQHNVMLTEAPMNPKQHREKMTQIMFETFCAPSMFIGSQAVLSLFSSSHTTGLVVDVGDRVSHSVPIFEGHSLPHAVTSINVGSRDLTEYMMKLLMETGRTFTTSAEKEKLCYVALDFDEEMGKEEYFEEFELPDGESMLIGNQCLFSCPEALFNPRKILFRHECGIVDTISESITKCDTDIGGDMNSTIFLAVPLRHSAALKSASARKSSASRRPTSNQTLLHFLITTLGLVVPASPPCQAFNVMGLEKGVRRAWTRHRQCKVFPVVLTFIPNKL